MNSLPRSVKLLMKLTRKEKSLKQKQQQQLHTRKHRDFFKREENN